MTLYEINEQIQKAIELGFDPETGEILDSSALEALEIARDEKVENICLYIKDLNAEAKAIAEEAKTLTARKNHAEKKAESLRNYLQMMLAGEKFKTSRCSVSYRKTTAVLITDEAALPEDMVRVTIEPNKTAIKDAIKTGKTVPGAQMEERQSMIIK